MTAQNGISSKTYNYQATRAALTPTAEDAASLYQVMKSLSGATHQLYVMNPDGTRGELVPGYDLITLDGRSETSYFIWPTPDKDISKVTKFSLVAVPKFPT